MELVQPGKRHMRLGGPLLVSITGDDVLVL